MLNPIRYRGYYYDTETGLYLTDTRYYDPETGRFINADVYASTGQGVLGHNMYAYCLNNPVNFADPTGCACICLTQRVGPRHVCESVRQAQKAEDNRDQMRDVTDEVNAALMPAAQKARDKRNNANSAPSVCSRGLCEGQIYGEFYKLCQKMRISLRY